MFPLFTYRQKRAQSIERHGNGLWDQYVDQRLTMPDAYQNAFNEDGFWTNYERLIKKSQKKQPKSSLVVTEYIEAYDRNVLYTFSELGRLCAILNSTIFSFCFLFIFSAMIDKNLLVQKELYFLLIPLSIFAGIFFARPFKTCTVTSNLLIIQHPWMLVNKTFVLHHIREVTIDDDPNGYWFIKICTNKKVYKYSVNINYCKLRKLLDYLGENHIATYDKISLSV